MDSAPAARSRSQPAAEELLEREHEIEQLTSFLGGVDSPGARLGWIEGPAGIGKSCLLAETRRIAASDGITVLAARGSELEREFPYGVVRQLFEPSLTDPELRVRGFAGAATAAAPIFEAPLDGAGAADDAGFATLHGLYWLTLNVSAEQPLLLAIDDLHWCDRPSLRFLAYLVRRLEELPVLVAATARPGETGADAALLAEIAADRLTASVRPGPLSEPAVTRLIEDRLGTAPDGAFVAACHSATGGNPLLLHELLKAVRAENVEPRAGNADAIRELGPRAASRAVLLRLARLPEAATKVARAIAVLGDGADLWAVAELVGLEERETAEATAELARAEILRQEPPLGFVHPLVRDAVYLELPAGARELEHTRAAELLQRGGATAEQIAAHLLFIARCGSGWAADVLVDAARSGAHKGAAETSVALLTRALAEPLDGERRAQVLFELGHAELHTQAFSALPHLREAYETLADPRQRAETATSLSRALAFTGAPDEAMALARGAAAGLPDSLEDERFALEAVELMSVVFGASRPRELERLERYREGAPGSGPGARMLAAAAAYQWSNAGGSADQCAALAREALSDPLLIERDHGLFWVAANVVLVYADDARALDVWEAARREAHRRGSLFGFLTVNLWGGWTNLRWGNLGEAEEMLAAAAEETQLWSPQVGIVEWPAAILCETRVERGDLAGARSALDAAHGFSPRSHGADFWRGSRAELLLHEGRLDEALVACDEYCEHLDERANPSPHPWRSFRAVILDRLGRTGEALDLVRDEVEVARRWGAPGATGRALRRLGELERENGLDHLREAVDVLEGSVSRLQLAKAHFALGHRLRLARRPTEAREPLGRALELATVSGAGPLAERSRAELHATGARLRREALSGAGALTASEKRVAELAAAGGTNREIAQELFVTPKTVEVHLSNAYRKLGIRGRRELVGALAA
jgi:DNA-binding CsgD family transcriptional regulator